MFNPINTREMTDIERVDEVADILAAGILRMRMRQARRLAARRKEREIPLDCLNGTSPDGPGPQTRGKDR